ncbi:hypothetical protein POM88_024446 [Heracleum sosnowskyi]|uniref:Nuclear pore complex protein GP210 C-terminal Ig-like domain-containing protein n=1 Tax=Heracleum sosnowskyi TaxID=360622 RepID=A0AAD8MLY5_9APIA|nr:hypothetical protein POM88_024446 [Heracleum sosnowskyi]
MKLTLISYLIVLLLSDLTVSLPELHRGTTDADTAVTTVIHCEVYFTNLTRIHILDDYVKLDTEEHVVASIGKLTDAMDDTSVSADTSSQGVRDLSGSGSVMFTGGFGIMEMNSNSLQLNLTPKSNKSVVVVTNNTDVEVQWQGWDRLQITPLQRETHRVAGHAEYEIRVRGVEGLKEKVIISLANNSQRMEIDVNYEPEKKSPPSRMDKTSMESSSLTILYHFLTSARLSLSLVSTLLFLNKALEGEGEGAGESEDEDESKNGDEVEDENDSESEVDQEEDESR